MNKNRDIFLYCRSIINTAEKIAHNPSAMSRQQTNLLAYAVSQLQEINKEREDEPKDVSQTKTT